MVLGAGSRPRRGRARAIERAKGILTAKEGIIEDVVSARLRPARRKSARPMRVIAVAVAATLG